MLTTISLFHKCQIPVEMKQAFKLYPRNLVLNIANSQIYSTKQIQKRK